MTFLALKVHMLNITLYNMMFAVLATSVYYAALLLHTVRHSHFPTDFSFSVPQVNLKEQGQLIRQDEFLVTFRKKKCFRHIFLFQELVLFSKTRKTDVGNDTYIYKQSFKVRILPPYTQKSHEVQLCKNVPEVPVNRTVMQGHSTTTTSFSRQVRTRLSATDLTSLLQNSFTEVVFQCLSGLKETFHNTDMQGRTRHLIPCYKMDIVIVKIFKEKILDIQEPIQHFRRPSNTLYKPNYNNLGLVSVFSHICQTAYCIQN